MIASLLSWMDVMQRHQSEPQRRVRINGYRRGDWKKVATLLINQDNANSREKKGGKQTAEEQERKRKKRVENKCSRESKALIE